MKNECCEVFFTSKTINQKCAGWLSASAIDGFINVGETQFGLIIL